MPLSPIEAATLRLLMLAVPFALAGCQDGGDALAPELADGAAEVSASASPGLLAAASLDRIAFMNVTDNGSDIWGMSATGTNQKRMTSFGGDEDDPIWSPDHSRIAFVRQRGSHLDVYLMNADGSNGHWAMPKDPGYVVNVPSWAPDGKSLLAQIWVNGPYVGKIDLATGEWSHVAPAGHYGLSGRNPIYSKDGKWIYYLAPANRDLRKFQPGGQDVSVKLFSSAIDRLAISPDGTKLAYLWYPSGNNDIYVLTLSNGQIKRLTYDSHSDIDPAWSPDGAKIAFVSTRVGGTKQIYVMNSSDGSNVTKLTSKTGGADHPTWYR